MARFALIVDGVTIPIQVVSNMSWGGEQSVVVYESPGTNGGVVLLNGRVTRKRTLTGRIITVPGLTLTQIKNFFDNVRDQGKVVTLISPIDDNTTENFVISSFTGNVEEGIESFISFTMELTEYRQANIRTAAVNLIALGPAERVREIIRERNIAGGT